MMVEIKLGIKILLLTTFYGSSNCFSNNENFLVALEKTRVKCITNSSKALSWNIPSSNSSNKFLIQVSEFAPQSQYSCDFKILKSCKKFWEIDPWSSENSITGSVQEPIFDRRWETFTTFSTEIEEVHIFNIRNSSYVIPFSVRSQRDAKVILTDGIVRYSIGIPSFWNQVATITRCENDTINCGKFSQIPNFKQQASPNTDKNIWKHYKLIVNSNNLSLNYLDGNGGEFLILSFTNFDIFTKTSVRVATDGFRGLWKIHYDKYLSTDSEDSWTLGPKFNVVNGTFCFSILVSMCKTCTLSLALKGNNNPPQIFKNSQNSTLWQEIRFFRENIFDRIVELQVTTKVDSVTDRKFWAISNPRQCQKHELRVLTLTNFRYQKHCSTLCQLISSKKNPIRLLSKNSKSKTQSNGSFGKALLPCELVYGQRNCSKIKICEENENDQVTCTKVEELYNCVLDEQINLISIILYSLLTLALLLVILAILYIVKLRRQGKHLRNLHFNVNRIRNSNLVVRLIRLPPRIRPERMAKEEELFPEPIGIKHFEEYVHKAVVEDIFTKHFKLMSKTEPMYMELIDPEASIVVLDEINEGNYIEASGATYIDGYNCSKAFIITQTGVQLSPTLFWKMVWQENIRNVVKLDMETENFWPSTEEEFNNNDIKARLVTSRNFSNYEWKLFKVTFRRQEREINLLSFTEWQHHAPICSQNLVPFLQKLLKITLDPKSPILIQCSTKMKRIGVVILSDSCLRMAAQENSIDVLTIWRKMRNQKAIITQELQAYKLAHFAILECLSDYHGEISCFELINEIRHIKTNDFVKLQANCINSFAEGPNNTKIYENIDAQATVSIRALPVDCYRSPNRFLVMQYPTPALLPEFWQFVIKNDISTIVSLNEIASDPTLKEFWQVKKIKVTRLDQTEKSSEFELTTLVVDTTTQIKRVQVISKKHWLPSRLLPKNIHGFMTFWEKSSVLTRKPERVLVVCRDGVTACGLYVAMSFLIEKMKLEQTCDVSKTVEAVRRGCPYFLSEKEQLIFLYEAAGNYLKRFGNYSNFL